MSRDIRPARTAAAAALGGTIGTLVLGAAVGYGLDALLDSSGSTEGLTTLGAAIAAGATGGLVGASIALAVITRDVPARERRIAIVVTLLVGPSLCALVALGIGRTPLVAEVDARHLFVVWLAVALPAAAVLGRWISMRASGDGHGA